MGYFVALLVNGPWILMAVLLGLRLRRERRWELWLQFCCALLVALYMLLETAVVGPLAAHYFRSSPIGEFPAWLNWWAGFGGVIQVLCIPAFCAGFFLKALNEREVDTSRSSAPAIITLGSLALAAVLAVIFRNARSITGYYLSFYLSFLLANAIWGLVVAGALLTARRRQELFSPAQLIGAGLLVTWLLLEHVLTNPHLGPFKNVPLYGPALIYPWLTTSKLAGSIGLWCVAVGFLPRPEPDVARDTNESGGDRPRVSPVPICLGISGLLALALVAVEFLGVRTGSFPWATLRTQNVIRVASALVDNYRRANRQYPWPRMVQVRSDTRIDAARIVVLLSGREGGPDSPYVSFLNVLPEWYSSDGKLVDAWGNPLLFRMDPETGRPVIWSCGPDGRDDTGDGESPDPKKKPGSYYWFGKGDTGDDVVYCK